MKQSVRDRLRSSIISKLRPPVRLDESLVDLEDETSDETDEEEKPEEDEEQEPMSIEDIIAAIPSKPRKRRLI